MVRGGFDLSAASLPQALAPLPLHNTVTYSSTHHAAVMQLLVGFLCFLCAPVSVRLTAPAY